MTLLITLPRIAKRDGKTLEEQCQAGSAAAAKMAADIDAGLVKDPDLSTTRRLVGKSAITGLC